MVAAGPRTELAGGCCVCAALPEEALSLRDRPAIVCRPCAERLGRFLGLQSDAFLAALWDAAPPPGAAGERRANVLVASEEDALAHYDLGCAYIEMDLACDAIGELAAALAEAASHRVAANAFELLFGAAHARPDALAWAVAELHARGR
jgi:hypothetical protein